MLYFLGNTVLLMMFLITLAMASGAYAMEIREQEKSFKLSEIENILNDKLSTQLSEENIQLQNVSIKRDSGKKSFSFQDVENLKLKSRFTFGALNIDNSKKSFAANVTPEEGDYNIEITGNFSALEKLPVLSSNIRKGDVITQNDIELKLVNAKQIRATTIYNITQIIGKQATRNLSKGNLLNFTSVTDPVVIKKSKAVNAIYRIKNLEVRTVAISLQDGKEGDIIRLKNHESGKIFQAIVQADGSVNTNINATNNSIALNPATRSNNRPYSN